MIKQQRGLFWFAFLAGMALLTILDQWTKALAVEHLMNQPPIVLIRNVFQLYYSENRGAAFGIFQGKQIFFLIVTAAVLAVAVYVLWNIPLKKHYMPLAFAVLLVSSGAVGNMIDRVLNGYVVDFLYFNLIDFPIFNVADCYVTVGAFLLILLIFFFYGEEELTCLTHKRDKEEKR